MNLNRNLKNLIVTHFKSGEDLATIAGWYQKGIWQIEQVIRDAMIERDAELERQAKGSADGGEAKI
jgi:hypothetical protein